MLSDRADRASESVVTDLRARTSELDWAHQPRWGGRRRASEHVASNTPLAPALPLLPSPLISSSPPETTADRGASSVMCPDLLAWPVVLTHRETARRFATLRPRRLRSGYSVATTAGPRYIFTPRRGHHPHPRHLFFGGTLLPHPHHHHHHHHQHHYSSAAAATAALGSHAHSADDTVPAAVVRAVRPGVTALDIDGETYITYRIPNAFLAIDRVAVQRKRARAPSSAPSPSPAGAGGVVREGAGDGGVVLERVGIVRILSRPARRAAWKTSPFVFDFLRPVPLLLAPLLVIIIRETAASASAAASERARISPVLLQAPVVALTAAVGAATC